MVAVGQGDGMAIAAMGYFYSLEELLFAWLCFGHGSKCSRSENEQSGFPPHQCHLCSLVFQSLTSCHGRLLAPSIPAYGSGYTLAFLQAVAAKFTPLTPQEKGLCPARSSPWSSSLRSLMDMSCGTERGRGIGVLSGLQAWFLPWPERRAKAQGVSLGAEWQRTPQGQPAAGPRAWAARAGTAPWASWAQGLPRGQHPKGLPPKDAGWRGSGRGCTWRGGPVTPVSQCQHPATQQSQWPGAG